MVLPHYTPDARVPVTATSRTDGEVHRFNSLDECARFLKVSSSTISKSIIRNKEVKGYTLRKFKNLDNPTIQQESPPKPVQTRKSTQD